MIDQHLRRCPAIWGRVVAFLGAVATLLSGAWILWTAVVQSSGAPGGWRLHLFLLEALLPIGFLAGFSIATSSSARTRRIGWRVVALSLAATMLWGKLATLSLPAATLAATPAAAPLADR